MLAEILVLRLIHIVAGTFWVGTAIFTTAFLMPAMREAGPAAGSVMAGFQKRRLMVYMSLAATLTVLSGLRLLWIISGGFASSFLQTSRGLTFTASGVLALVAYLAGMLIARPMNARMGALGARIGAAPEAERTELQTELGQLQKASALIALLVVILLVLATAGMGIARYL